MFVASISETETTSNWNKDKADFYSDYRKSHGSHDGTFGPQEGSAIITDLMLFK